MVQNFANPDNPLAKEVEGKREQIYFLEFICICSRNNQCSDLPKQMYNCLLQEW